MKKLFAFSLLLAAIVSTLSCSSPKEWSEEQQVEFVTMLDPYREMIYLREFNDAEYLVFTDELTTDAQAAYPVYTRLVALPALSDTLDMWVVTSIVDDLDADASNMRYLYPYHILVNQGILPEGLDHNARLSFYRCFAQKVNNNFSSLENFFYAVITNSVEPNVISTMQGECASDLFDFTVEITAVEED